MFLLEKARSALGRWFSGGEGTSAPPSLDGLADRSSGQRQSDDDETQIFQFFEELRSSSQDWLGRVRLVSLEDIRERLGRTWNRLQGKVEILTEMVIEADISKADRYLKIGPGEFLVFFRDATSEESKIRCLAILQQINGKVFGQPTSGRGGVAECHLVHRDAVESEYKSRRGDKAPGPSSQSIASRLRRAFESDPQRLDVADLATLSHGAITNLINQALKTNDLAELAPLLLRLKELARSLKVLEPALRAIEQTSIDHEELCTGTGKNSREAFSAEGSLAPSWEDIVQLISVLTVTSDRSLQDRRAALEELLHSRMERAAFEAREGRLLRSVPAQNIDVVGFQYLPVYQPDAAKNHILLNVHRVEPILSSGADYVAIRECEAGSQMRDCALKLERATLEHAVACLAEREPPARCMLMVTVHVDTLRSPHSQMRYSTILRAAQALAKRNLTVEVTGYRDTDDTIGVRRGINELRANSHSVFLTIAEGAGNFAKIAAECKNLEVGALGISVRHYADRQPAMLAILRQLSRACHQSTVPLFVGGIGDIPGLAKSIATGAQYVAGRALWPPQSTPDKLGVVTLDDLYAAVLV